MSTMKHRAALIGCGRMGANTAASLLDGLPDGYVPLNHADAMLATGRISLVACCDTDEQRMAAVAARFNAAPFTDARLLIDKIKPDMIALATRTESRCDVIEYAAEHGVKAIHLEKPISRNMADCMRALDAARRNHVALTYGATRRFMDVYRNARQMVQSGAIGELREIVVSFGHSPLLWYHPHSVDLLLFFAGTTAVRSVSALSDIKEASGLLVDSDPIIDHAFVQFDNGVRGTITGAGGFHITVSGTEGTLTVASNGSWIDILSKATSESIVHRKSERIEVNAIMSGTAKAFYELADAIEDGAPTSVTADEIEVSQRILMAFTWSAMNGGKAVGLNDFPIDLTVTGKTGQFYA